MCHHADIDLSQIRFRIYEKASAMATLGTITGFALLGMVRHHGARAGQVRQTVQMNAGQVRSNEHMDRVSGCKYNTHEDKLASPIQNSTKI